MISNYDENKIKAALAFGDALDGIISKAAPETTEIYEMQKVCKNFLYPFLQQIGGFRNETKRKLEPHISIFGGLIVKKVGNSSGKIYYFPLIHFTIQSQKLFWFPTHGWENWIQIRDRQKRRTHSVSYFDGQIVVEQISFILFYFSSQPN